MKGMGIFKNVNQNLFEMYFSYKMLITNQFDYYIKLYSWNKEIENNLQRKKDMSANYHSVAYQWMNKGIPVSVFGTLLKEINLDAIPEVIYNFCYEHLKTVIKVHHDEKLKKMIEDMIFFPETNLKYKFKWEEKQQNELITIYRNTDVIKTLATLLILSQTKRIIYPTKKYNIKSDFAYVRVYDKEVIEENFDVLLDGSKEINMMQISCPSLIEHYSDFFKSTNKKALMNALRSEERPHLNMIFLDPECDYALELMNTFMYGNSFANDKKVIYDSIDFALNLKREFPGQVCVKTVSVPISYSILQAKKEETSYLKIDIYNIVSSASERCSILFDNKENKEFYDMYAQGFNRIFYHPLTKIL